MKALTASRNLVCVNLVPENTRQRSCPKETELTQSFRGRGGHVSRMTKRERAPAESLSFRPNLILQSDTVWCFSGEFVMIQADVKRCKALIIKAGMTWDDS